MRACPFCGTPGRARVKWERTERGAVKQWVECGRCLSRGPFVVTAEATADDAEPEARRLWDDRHDVHL